MGNQQYGENLLDHQNNKKKRMTELTETESYQESIWEQSIEYSRCFCISRSKVIRKKIIWENDFIKNCNQIKDQFEWANDLIELVNNYEMPKQKYFREIHNLKKQKNAATPTETEILKSPAEVQTFKKNLRKSVILSFAHNTKINQEIPSKITTNINMNNRRSRIEIQRYSKNLAPPNKSAIIVGQRAKSISSKGGSVIRKSMMSFIDDTFSSAMDAEKQISKQTAKQLQIFLKFSMILERHLGDLNCMLGRIKKLFTLYVEKKFKNSIQTSKNIGEFVDNIKQFLVILKEAVIDYYNLTSFGEGDEANNMFIANEENVLSACTAILFRDHNFYKIVFNAILYNNHQRQQKFAKILTQLKGSSPQRFSVKDRFCLNQRTIKSYLNDMSAESGSQQHVQNIQINDVLIQNGQPYKYCMNNLNELMKSRSPINKMKAIMACSQGITQQIERFYDLNGLRKQKWMLDADQVLSIFCYIIVGANVQHLHTHLFILDNFATSHQMISMTGYYLSVINCAVQQLQKQFGLIIEQQEEGN